MSSNLRIAVVTGSNKGIGYGIVKNLCEKFNGLVYLTSRDKERGMKAVESLSNLGLKPEYHQLDVDKEESVKEFAKFIKKNHGGFDVLVNNAGVGFNNDSNESLWNEAVKTVRTNYFGLLRVCDSLFPLLKPHARIVNMSSSLGHLSRIPGEHLRKCFSDPNLTVQQLSHLINEFLLAAKEGDYKSKGWPDNPYIVSKVGVSALTLIQHREFMRDLREDMVINSVHPGYVRTDLSKQRGRLTIEQGAEAPTYLALLPAGTTSPRGEYIWKDKQIVDWINGPTPSKL